MSSYLLYVFLFPQLIVFGTIDRIEKSLEKKEYDKALELIERGREKEPENPGVDYYRAVLYFDKAFDQYSIDSARCSIRSAKEKFSNATAEKQQESTEEGFSEEEIKRLEEKIRDQEFQNTLQDLRFSNIRKFEKNYPASIYEPVLTYKKDSIAFAAAKKKNTQDAYQTYISKRPTSVFATEADSLLDNMRVNDLVETGSLTDYYRFLKKYPLTRRRSEIERYILKVSTASHEPQDYLDFLRLSQLQRLQKIAGDFHFLLTGEISSLHPIQDSLRKITKLTGKALFPTLSNNQFGYYDESGTLAISNQYEEIAKDAKCHLVMDDWVFVKETTGGKILRKDGALILNRVDDYRSISPAIALISRQGQWYLYHKSGYRILNQPVESAKVLQNRWIRYRQQDKFGLLSFLGLSIARADYDDIYSHGPFWIFEREGRTAVYTDELILNEVEDKGLALEFKFDEVEWVNDSTLIGFRGTRECLLDASLNFLIPWGEYEINPDPNGWYLRLTNGYKIYDPQESEVLKRIYPYIESSQDWLALKTANDWMLIPRTKGVLPSRGYDSVKLIGKNAAWVVKETDNTLLFSSGAKRQTPEPLIQLLRKRNDYLLLEGNKKLSLLNGKGEELIAGDFEELTFVNDTLLRVQVRKKQGLMTLAGDWVLNPVFQTIDEKEGLILTLNDGKIGCFDLQSNTLIPTIYEARIVRIGDFYLAKKDGKYGLINSTAKIILDFEFAEIKAWNDSSYLVSRDGIYEIIDASGESKTDPFEDVLQLVSNSDQNIYRIVRDGKYGLLSNRYGEFLKAEYTEILNIGTTESPLIFADQHLDKAGFHVVSYIDKRGELIISRAYTKKEFDRILCDD